ncbi:hypothetical protein BGZ94_002963 [Podila epigama]|nr:hypothetical protein BGZ94_002963 [Podila epigama]
MVATPEFQARLPFDNDPMDHYYTTAFLGRRSVRDTWITLFVLWLLWAGLFLAKQLFRHKELRRAHHAPAAVTTDAGPYSTAGATTGQSDLPISDSERMGTTIAPGQSGHIRAHNDKGFLGRVGNNMRDRVDRTHDLIRDLTLMLLLVVTLNTFGRGSGIAVLVLSWIYLAVAILWAGVMILVESRILDLMMGALAMIILLAMLIAAYSMGWAVMHF